MFRTYYPFVISVCLYLIKLLKHRGMPQQQLSVVTYSIIVSRILYALPAWGGFLSVELKIQNRFLFQAPQTIWLHKLYIYH